MQQSVPVHGTPSPNESRARSAWSLRPPTPPARPTRLLLACHAENVQSRQLHLTPDEAGLSAKGWEQTTALAQWLHAHEEIDVLLTDTPLRARLTAQRIGQQLDLRLQALPYWPRGGEAAWALEPPIATPSNQSPEAVARYTTYSEELVNALSRLLTDRWGKTILLVTDAVTIATLLRSFAPGAELGIGVAHTSTSEVVYHEGRWALAYINRTEHIVRRSPLRRTAPAEDNQQQTVDRELNAEIEKIAQFYNQMALRLDHESSEQPENRQPPAQDMSSEQIRRFAELGEESRLLLAGAGSGWLALDLAQSGIGEVVGVDVSPVMLEKAEFLRLSTKDVPLQRVNFRLAPAHDLPFQDGRFDAALCVHLLHHLANPRPTLRELYRLLPAHGRLILIDIDGSDDAVKRATQNAIENRRNPTHATIRTGKQLTSLLEECGFQVEKEQRWKVERSATVWLSSIAVDEATHTAVLEMLEASVETDAAGLHVRRQGNDLRFDAQIVAFLARKTAG
ncbi:MAG: methyltransferase domain-containing protein [Chloroflexi bacterium]|nr:methyltransferase domain-containing protein [Chloroflexota bacterium]